jgi:hypothetical protein
VLQHNSCCSCCCCCLVPLACDLRQTLQLSWCLPVWSLPHLMEGQVWVFDIEQLGVAADFEVPGGVRAAEAIHRLHSRAGVAQHQHDVTGDMRVLQFRQGLHTSALRRRSACLMSSVVTTVRLACLANFCAS